jgi:O-antigen ligase
MGPLKIKALKKEAHKIPVIICLFFVPLFFIPFFPMPFTQGKEILLKVVLLVTLLTAVLVSVIRGRFTMRKLYESPLSFILVSTAAIAVVADALSPVPLVALYGTYDRGFGLIVDLYLLFFALYCANALNQKDLRPLLRWAFISGVAAALYGLLQKIGVDPFFRGYDTDIFVGRIFGLSGNPGYLGQLMMLISLIGMHLFWTAKDARAKVAFILGLFAVFSAMVFSGTRTAFFALAVVAILSGIKYRKNIWARLKGISKNRIPLWKKTVAVLGVIAVFGAALAVMPKDRFTLSSGAFRSVESRAEIWKGAIVLFLQRPFTGYGEESFYIYFPETITKRFLTLEEEVNLTADRIHNESIEKLFSYGIAGGIAYLVLFFWLIMTFFRSKNGLEAVLAVVPAANIIQNQFGFSDIPISVLSCFCLGSLIALQTAKRPSFKWRPKRIAGTAIAVATVVVTAYVGYMTVYRPVMSQVSYARSVAARSVDYALSVNSLKRAIDFTPYYGKLWYELMFIDPSSMPRALDALEMIEGESGSVLAWKGNMFSQSDPQKAADFYLRALEKNPWNPSWSRAFGDMLYRNGDYENALFMYRRFLEAAPDFWKWSSSLDSLTPEEQKSYRVFFKNSPDFLNTVARVQGLEIHLSGR